MEKETRVVIGTAWTVIQHLWQMNVRASTAAKKGRNIRLNISFDTLAVATSFVLIAFIKTEGSNFVANALRVCHHKGKL